MIVRISKKVYNAVLAEFIENNPERGAHLTPDPDGQAYFFPEYKGFAVLKGNADMSCEIRGVFKLGDKPGFAHKVASWALATGHTSVHLDCFMPVSDAWAAAGLLAYKLEPFDEAKRPANWQDAWGTPSVVYMHGSMRNIQEAAWQN